MASVFSKSANVLFAEILLKVSSDKRSVMLVGGPTDKIFWQKFVSANEVNVIECGGKLNVVNVLNNDLESIQVKLFGVIDRDYDDLCGMNFESECLFYGDHVNLEAMLGSSEACSQIFEEYTDRAKRIQLEREKGRSLLQFVLRAAVTFGAFRALNESKKLMVDFTALSPFRFLDELTWELKFDLLRTEFEKKTNTSAKEVGEQFSNLLEIYESKPWHIVHGKDFFAIIAIGLRSSILGQDNAKSVGLQDMERAFRLCFGRHDLVKTQIYGKLRGFENRQPNLKIFDW
jgi:hypothetical protein